MENTPQIEPNTEADSGNLLVSCGLIGGVELTVLSIMVAKWLLPLWMEDISSLWLLLITIPSGSWLGITISCMLLQKENIPTDIVKVNPIWLLAMILACPVLLMVGGAFMMLPPFVTFPLFAIQLVGLLLLVGRQFRIKRSENGSLNA